MFRYTIYTTAEQTKRALSLGAPIEQYPYYDIVKHEFTNFYHDDKTRYMFPTAEQMICWLEEIGIDDIRIEHEKYTDWCFFVFPKCDNISSTVAHSNRKKFFTSRKEATLAAIDEALTIIENANKARE